MSKMQIIGHRGALVACPENTIMSFDRAIADGASAIEFDVRRCRDGLVVIHDSQVDRTTNGSGRVKRMSVEQLQKLDLGQGQKISTLEAVLGRFAGCCQIFLEIKSRQIAADVAALITQLVVDGRFAYADIVVICFYPDILEKIRAVNSGIQIGLHLVEANVNSVNKIIDNLRPQYLLPSIGVLSPKTVKSAHQNSIKVVTWTAKTETEIQTAHKANVDGIIVDDVMMAQKVLQNL